MNNAQIIVGTYGNGLAIGLSGTTEAIERAFNRFFNWGAVGGGNGADYLHQMSETFSYFLTTERDMLRAMTYETMTRWQDSPVSEQYKARPRTHKKVAGRGFRKDAENAARDEFNSFPRENFLGMDKSPIGLYRELDGGAPDWVSETED